MNKYIKIIIIVVILTLLIASPKLYKYILVNKIYPQKYREYIEKYSKQYEIDPLLIYAIIKAESNFNEKAKSSRGARGLMQLMTNTALEFAEANNEPIIDSEDEILDPEKNIMLGIKYYAHLYERYNDNMLLALAAYNAGPGNVDKWIADGTIDDDGSNIENIPFKETNMYVRKIVNNYRMYQELYK